MRKLRFECNENENLQKPGPRLVRKATRFACDSGPEEGTRTAVAWKVHQDEQKVSWMVNFELFIVSDSVLLFGFYLMDLGESTKFLKTVTGFHHHVVGSTLTSQSSTDSQGLITSPCETW